MREGLLEQLKARGARVEEGRVLDFGDPAEERRAAEEGSVVAELGQRGLVRLSGPDMESFVQNQLAGDLRRVSDRHTSLSAHCTPKGRVLALYRLYRDGDGLLVSAPRATLERALPRLRMMILRAKVQVEELGDSVLRLGVAGANAGALVHEALGAPVPAEDEGVVDAESVLVARLPARRERFELIVRDAERASKIFEVVAAQATPVGDEAWRVEELLAGRPEVHAENAEEFLPQFLWLEKTGGVAFDKGCFPGQEVVARTQNLGKVVRRMILGHLPAEVDAAPDAGTPLRAIEGERDKEAGRVVDAARRADGRVATLAVVPVALLESGAELRVGGAEGPVLAPQAPLFEG